jgi:hypothetical protein
MLPDSKMVTVVIDSSFPFEVRVVCECSKIGLIAERALTIRATRSTTQLNELKRNLAWIDPFRGTE